MVSCLLFIIAVVLAAAELIAAAEHWRALGKEANAAEAKVPSAESKNSNCPAAV